MREAQIVRLLTVSGNVQRLPISHNTTTGTGVLLTLAGTAAASWRHVLQAAAHSWLELRHWKCPVAEGGTSRRWHLQHHGVG